MPSVAQLLLDSGKRLMLALGLDATEARIEAHALLRLALGSVSRAWLLTHENDALEGKQGAAFEALLKRRLNGEPIAYILGKREFYGLEFIVTPDTLIPRPDTETLVEAALAKIPTNQTCSVLDLGTGTGAIAITIASQRPQAQVTAVDASPAALAVAQSNAQNLDVNNVQFVLSDWFTALAGQTFDVIVSNPPYVAANDPHLNQGDLRFEPVNALAAGEDGLDCIRQIISQAREHLNPQGWLMFEHGYNQAEKVAQLLKSANFDSVSSVADLSGILRVTLGKSKQ
jgi:release factor glutamine methyltransferase